jgi:hypothetical protein
MIDDEDPKFESKVERQVASRLIALVEILFPYPSRRQALTTWLPFEKPNVGENNC